MKPSIVLEHHDRVSRLTIDRPPLNILDLATIRELSRVLSDLTCRRSLQVLIVTGSGERAFSAGVAVEDHTPDKVATMLKQFHDAITTLRDIPAATLAVVQGHCLGGGMELAAGCDLILASDDATFGQPEIKLGCYPPLAAALYPSLIGDKRTADLLLTGRSISCQEACEIGFVSRSAERAEMSNAVQELVESLISQSLAVTRLTKRAILAGRNLGFPDALAECERLYLEELVRTRDMHEGLAAFIDKRSPDWDHS